MIDKYTFQDTVWVKEVKKKKLCKVKRSIIFP